MSKRTAIIIIVAVILVGTAILYFLLGGKTPSGLPIFTGSPFGAPPEDTPVTPGSGDQPMPIGVDNQGRELPRFVRLSEAPVAGAVSFIKNGLTHVRYVDRATGHVYDINPSTLERTKIINITRPRVYNAIFKDDASGYIARTLDDDREIILSTAVSIIPPKATSTDYSVQASILRGNLGDLDVLPNSNLIYVSEDPDAVLASSFTGEKATSLLSSPFIEWQLQALSNANILITTKASEVAEGFAYKMDTSNGRLTKVLGPLLALSALSNPDGTRFAYHYIDGRGDIFSTLHQNGANLEIRPTTLPEKCVWSRKDLSALICGAPDSGLGVGAPDNWYLGVTSYVDKIWRFNTDTNTSEILLDPVKNFDTEVDAMDLFLSPDEDYLFFTSKKDLSLWALKLKP